LTPVFPLLQGGDNIPRSYDGAAHARFCGHGCFSTARVTAVGAAVAAAAAAAVATAAEAVTVRAVRRTSLDRSDTSL